MSNGTRKTKKIMAAKEEHRKQQLLKIDEWATIYKYDYPLFFKFSTDPNSVLLSLMEEFNVSIVKAAQLAEDFADEFKNQPNIQYHQNENDD